jgi:hypothetical protein
MLPENLRHYILTEQGTILFEPDHGKWEDWFAKTDRHIAYDRVDGSFVSTIFLAIGWDDSPNPMLWETVVLGGKLDQVRDRCAGTKSQAELMHAKMVERVKSLKP